MSTVTMSSFARGMTLVADSISASIASLWPWSMASVEARRLARDGYALGTPADIFYLVSFDDAAPDAALAALRSGGFLVRDPAPQGGFVTVRARIRLGAFALTIAGTRLDRIVEQFDGFATLIGAGTLPVTEGARSAAGGGRRAIAT
jgi:hypothetical protein